MNIKKTVRNKSTLKRCKRKNRQKKDPLETEDSYSLWHKE